MSTFTRDGVTYRITSRVKVTSGRNFGKILYTLTDPDGRKYLAMAKPGKLPANARLSEKKLVACVILSTQPEDRTGN